MLKVPEAFLCCQNSNKSNQHWTSLQPLEDSGKMGGAVVGRPTAAARSPRLAACKAWWWLSVSTYPSHVRGHIAHRCHASFDWCMYDTGAKTDFHSPFSVNSNALGVNPTTLGGIPTSISGLSWFWCVLTLSSDYNGSCGKIVHKLLLSSFLMCVTMKNNHINRHNLFNKTLQDFLILYRILSLYFYIQYITS